MRIPLSKVYRAFPELDRFSDAECERYVKRARRAQLKWMWVPVVAMPFSLALIAGLIFIITKTLDPTIRAIGRFADRALGGVFDAVFGPDLFPSDLLVPGAFLLASTIGPWLTFAVLRDRLLRRAIARRLEITECTACEQSLVGLPLLADQPTAAVRCPECGAVMVLSHLGLTPADIIARDHGVVGDGGNSNDADPGRGSVAGVD